MFQALYVNGREAMEMAAEWRAAEQASHRPDLPVEVRDAARAWLDEHRSQQVVVVTPCVVCKAPSKDVAAWPRVGTWEDEPRGVCEDCA